MRKPVSVTLTADNILWLRAQAATTARGSLSEVLDRLVTGAREGGLGAAAAMRSVVGTIDLPDDDPALERADAFVRAQFEQSIKRPAPPKRPRLRAEAGPRLVKGSTPRYAAKRKPRG